MKNLGIKISIFLNYFVFAILLNSVGIVIAKSINIYHVSESQASLLEAFKDLPIAIVSFIIASFLPRFGYKKAMLVGLAIVFFGCLLMIFGNSFAYTKILFLSIGISFALIKLSVYSLIGIVTSTKKEHSSLMSSIEGFFMVGIASAYFLFPAFYSDTDENAWLNVYYLISALIVVSFVFLLFSKVEYEVEAIGSSLKEDLLRSIKLIVVPLVLVFLASAFFFVMIEQGIMTWLPRFNEKIFKFSATLSVQMASILALSLALGRFLAGYLSKFMSWVTLVIICIIISGIILLSVLPQLKVEIDSLVEIKSLTEVPMLGFILPLIGLFIAPIYPLLNSTVLSSLPKNLHSPMSGLIIIFSALGGTIGSRIVGELFESIGGAKAFYFLLIPMALLIVFVLLIDRISKKNSLKTS
ncbi:MAG: MFS transporter [Flavobacteriales bacterium]|nr:MFS transporter [Flavobacteriia bacterium]NCP05602.1 MFS transporter [Flavobacteriales bacterium]PIV95019.1 MAG: MFS transporter [Flavobacteriaceae bacterium CG17_big_fil_post_rev_8_21_14_2_50_33_15]PIY09435.1 MAG: MFS transporter [Flavobacteriaceae bacterium CG_4_10_14_3_um_filter_33_47]PJB19967.1 MAG: MFS transporter [Flavobacteriaceae bacterium CG_4_9_14_3_um_filter_33_16]